MLLKFLYDHIAYGADFHARVKWQEKTVIVWDVSCISGVMVDDGCGFADANHLSILAESCHVPLGYPRLGECKLIFHHAPSVTKRA